MKCYEVRSERGDFNWWWFWTQKMFFKFLEISNPRTSHFFSDWLWPYCDRFFNFRLFLYSRRKSSGDATRSSEWSQAAKIRFPVFTLSVIRITHHKCYYVISFSYFFFLSQKKSSLLPPPIKSRLELEFKIQHSFI